MSERAGGAAHSTPEVLYADCEFTEGPAWFGVTGLLVWSDIPRDRMLYRGPDGTVGVFREPSHFANGNTVDRDGRLVTCEHGARRVTRTERDGTITVIADAYRGARLNSPNDVVVKSDGTVWFTDPDYGLRQNLPGTPRELDRDYVFRADPVTGALAPVVDDLVKPNGLAFSPDETVLYVADSAVTEGPDQPSHIRRFTVRDDGTLGGGAVFAETDGVPDGIRVDEHGNLWASAGPGIDVYAPSGALLERIEVGCAVTNLEFARRDGRPYLYVTAGGGLFGLFVGADGARPR